MVVLRRFQQIGPQQRKITASISNGLEDLRHCQILHLHFHRGVFLNKLIEKTTIAIKMRHSDTANTNYIFFLLGVFLHGMAHTVVRSNYMLSIIMKIFSRLSQKNGAAGSGEQSGMHFTLN